MVSTRARSREEEAPVVFQTPGRDDPVESVDSLECTSDIPTRVSRLDQSLENLTSRMAIVQEDVRRTIRQDVQEVLRKELQGIVRDEMKAFQSRSSSAEPPSTQAVPHSTFPFSVRKDRQDMTNTFRCCVDSATNALYASLPVIKPENLSSKVQEILDKIARYDLEVEVTWFAATSSPSEATTWRGIPIEEGEFEEQKTVVISYNVGNYHLPNPKLNYTRIEIVKAEPAMPDRLEPCETNADETIPEADEFKVRDVRTWNKYIATDSEFGVDFLLLRIRTALALPNPLPPNLQPMWDVMQHWVDDVKARGGIDPENVAQVQTGQRALDDLRMQQGVYRGADPRYLRMIYEVNKDPADVIGNGIEHSVNYQRKVVARRGGYGRATYPSANFGRGHGMTRGRGFRPSEPYRPNYTSDNNRKTQYSPTSDFSAGGAGRRM